MLSPDFAKIRSISAAKKAAKKVSASPGPKTPDSSGGMPLPWGEILMGAVLIGGLIILVSGDFDDDTVPGSALNQ